MAHDILLETGTNEVEFLEFYLKNQSFGVNVAKVKQLIRYDEEKITRLPEAYPSVVGSIDHLNRNIPVVNLGKHLKRQMWDNNDHRIVIITDFNRSVTGFIVDGVNKIHRITWEKLQPVSAALEHLSPRITGVVLVENREILILDFEYILEDIHPDLRVAGHPNILESPEEPEAQKPDLRERRKKANIYFAEDSNLFRGTMVQSLKQVGYENIHAYENGMDLHKALRLKMLNNPDLILPDFVDLVLTDIEMPQLDGLTLCKKIKEQNKNVPVVVLSSLITEEMSHKCESVGADDNISKKNLQKLLKVMDQLALK